MTLHFLFENSNNDPHTFLTILTPPPPSFQVGESFRKINSVRAEIARAFRFKMKLLPYETYDGLRAP